MDTEYLNLSDFYLENNKIRLKIDYEMKNKSLVLFIDKNKDKQIQKYKELLGYTKDKYYLAIIYITPDIQTMIDDSDDFLLSGDIVFYYHGKYKEKVKIQFESNLEKSIDRLDKHLLTSIGSTNSTDSKKENNSNKNTSN